MNNPIAHTSAHTHITDKSFLSSKLHASLSLHRPTVTMVGGGAISEIMGWAKDGKYFPPSVAAGSELVINDQFNIEDELLPFDSES